MASVDFHKITDYRNARCFLAEDETCGFAVSSDGERLSLFTAARGKRRSKVFRALAEEQGAAHLTHYDGYLCYNETKDITMKLIAGLGNVGAKYCFSRHNAGFMLADKTALNNNVEFRENSKLKSLITKFSKNNDEYMVIKPITYMNLSGEAVRAVIDYYKLSPHDIIVIYDDLSLNLGKIRFRNSGSDGGHNGIKSVIQHLGTKDFPRLKIGIGPQPPIPSETFVLQNFAPDELDILKNVLNTAEDAVYYYFENGIEKTQNKYN